MTSAPVLIPNTEQIPNHYIHAHHSAYEQHTHVHPQQQQHYHHVVTTPLDHHHGHQPTQHIAMTGYPASSSVGEHGYSQHSLGHSTAMRQPVASGSASQNGAGNLIPVTSYPVHHPVYYENNHALSSHSPLAASHSLVCLVM